jgi:hypothetical protein
VFSGSSAFLKQLVRFGGEAARAVSFTAIDSLDYRRNFLIRLQI